MSDVLTIWDGEFIQHMPRDEAIAANALGQVQIFSGPRGYQPDFYMKFPQDFPFVQTNPADFFGPNDVGGVFDFSDLQYVFQDLLGTVPVTAAGQEVLSMRTYNNTNFLLKFNPNFATEPCTFEYDEQGYPCLQAQSVNNWTVYGIEDAGAPADVAAYSAVLCCSGVYDAQSTSLGAGSTIIGDTTGTQSPYSYSAVYADATVAPVDVHTAITIDSLREGFPYEGGSLDNNRPFVFSVRVQDGLQTLSINNDASPDISHDSFPTAIEPVGVRIWVGAMGRLYAGVVIGRYFSNVEDRTSAYWAGLQAGINI